MTSEATVSSVKGERDRVGVRKEEKGGGKKERRKKAKSASWALSRAFRSWIYIQFNFGAEAGWAINASGIDHARTGQSDTPVIDERHVWRD